MEPSGYDSFNKNLESIKRHNRKFNQASQNEKNQKSFYKAYQIVNAAQKNSAQLIYNGNNKSK